MEKRHANGHSQSNYNTSSGRGRSQIPRSLYIAPFLSLSLSFLAFLLLSPLSLMDRSSDSSRRHSVSLPGIRTLFPGIISGQRIFFQPKLIYPTRSSLGYRRQKSADPCAIIYRTLLCFAPYSTSLQRLVNRFIVAGTIGSPTWQ